MIVNSKIKAAWIATKSGINPRAIKDDKGYTVFSFPSEERFYLLRSEADNMSREELLAESDVCVNDYLRDLIWKNKNREW